MKKLQAFKVKDGWLVEITKTEHAHCESDVLKIIREQGLSVRAKTKDKGKVIRYFAD